MIDHKPEQLLIACMIWSKQAINEVVKIQYELKTEILQSQAAKTAFQWCVDYANKYNQPPALDIARIVETYKNAEPEKESVLLAEKLCTAAIEKYNQTDNWEHLLDNVYLYIRERKLELLTAKIHVCLERKEVKNAEEVLANYYHIQREYASGVAVFRESDVVARIIAQQEHEESILRFPGAFGELVGDLERGDLIAFASPAKRGKSWYMQECAVRGVLQKRVVLFYSLEMNEKQVLSRIAQQLTGQPRKYSDKGIDVKIPSFNDDNTIRVRRFNRKGLKPGIAMRAINKIKLLAGRGDIYVTCFPAYSASVKDIQNHMELLEREKNIVADIVVVDYADILSGGKVSEYRHQIDLVWKQLRALAQEKNCLVVTASHSNKSTYNNDMQQGDISEDIRKMNHVSCMIGLNQNNKDKENCVMRAVSLANRHEGFNSDEVVMLHQFEIGKPLIDSRWKKLINYDSSGGAGK
jgi:replicative DNA helicase